MEKPGIRRHPKFEGIFRMAGERRERLATLSLAPGTSVYGEDIVKVGDDEYRVWDPFRSKLAAAILNGLAEVPITVGVNVLYLGAASGTTASHISDIVGEKGAVFCVEFAQRSFRDLVNNACKNRPNMTPIFEDARFPSRYRSVVQNVDTIYSDVAQPDQARILADNADMYLENKRRFLMAIKARSIDVSKEPSTIFRQEKMVLGERGFKVVASVRLDPFEKDHSMVLGEK